MDTSMPVRISFLHTSDIHSRLLPYDLVPTATDQGNGLISDEGEQNGPFGGAARLAYLLKRERERSQRVIHLDSGDCYQGAPVFNYKKGEAEIRYMSLINPEAVVIGNHEFDDGIVSYVNTFAKWGTYTNLAANYVFPDPSNVNNHQLGKYAQPYTIIDVDGIKVGVIGMANLSSLNSLGEGGNSLQLLPMEQNSVARHYVNLLHPIVDLVVVVSHQGLTEDEHMIRGYELTANKYCNRTLTERVSCLEPEWQIIEELPEDRVRVFVPGVADIDIIFGGHNHIVLSPKPVEDPNGRITLMAHPGAFAKTFTRLDAMVADDPERGGKTVVAHKFQVFPVDNRLSTLEDPGALRLMEPYVLSMNQAYDLKRVVAYAPQTITRAPDGNSADSPLGNLLAEAMRRRRRVEAEFSMTNTLGIRDNIYAGPVTLEALFNVLPFENTVSVIYLPGYDVQELMDFATTRAAVRGCQAQAQVAGLSYVQNCAQVYVNQRTGSTTHTGQQIRINGQLLCNSDVEDPPEGCLPLSTTFKLATNNFMAAGGSGFRVLRRNTQKFDTGVSLRDSLIDYMQTLPPCQAFIDKTGICGVSDEPSKALCAELQKYADVPCIEGAQDGRIQTQLSGANESVIDDGTVDDDPGPVQ